MDNKYLQEMELFNKKVLFKTYTCSEDKDNPTITGPRIKLTIKVEAYFH